MPIPGGTGVAMPLREKLQQLVQQRPAAAPPAMPQSPAQHPAPGASAAASRPTPQAAVAPNDTNPAAKRRSTPSAIDTAADAIKSSLVMIVDDEQVNTATVCGYLKREGYREFLTVNDPRQALGLMKQRLPACLLLDINMPHISGLDILRAKSLDPALERIPTLILTASNDPHLRVQALEMGASDFLTKPVDPSELSIRVRNALLLKAHIDQITNQAAQLEAMVQRRTAELYQSRQQLILSLARAAEHRDNETSNHVLRVGRYAGLIARQLGWSEDKALLLEQAAQLHDVGKIGVPDAILFKPGKLDQQEYEIIKKHCAIGTAILEPYSPREMEVLRSHTRVGSDILQTRSSPLMMMAARIAQTHHERWDGTGYPLGLAGEDIPLEGRITSVADVFDALSSARPYKAAFSRERCFEILNEGRGTSFDPKVLDAFFARSKEIIEVQMHLMDREQK